MTEAVSPPSYYRMCSRTIECVPILQMWSHTKEYVLLPVPTLLQAAKRAEKLQRSRGGYRTGATSAASAETADETEQTLANGIRVLAI